MQFGLQFETVNVERKPKDLDSAKNGQLKSAAELEGEDDTKSPDSPAQDEAAKVVSLDHFRKK